MKLTSAQRRELLELVHKTLSYFFKHQRDPAFNTKVEVYLQPAGAFVTLFKGDQLRGCIGHTQADVPLYHLIQEMAISAATIDPRFPPVTEDELNELHVEISVLSPLFPITIEQVEIGTHGLLLEYGGMRGLLLPRVPVEHGWDKDTFLAHLCLKAGLPNTIWDKNPKLSAFTACEFGERDDYLMDCA